MRLWSASLRYACDDREADYRKKRQERGCRNCSELKKIPPKKTHSHYFVNVGLDSVSLFSGANFTVVVFSFSDNCCEFDDPTLNVDVLLSVLPVLSLCSCCSSSTCSAHTCFSLPPLNSLLWEKSKVRDCDLPWGWVKDSLPSFSWEMCPPPSLYFVYTWIPSSLLDQLTECRKSCCIQFPALFWIVQRDQ